MSLFKAERNGKSVCTENVKIEKRISDENSAADPFYSNKNIARLEKAVADINAGKVKVHELIETDGE